MRQAIVELALAVYLTASASAFAQEVRFSSGNVSRETTTISVSTQSARDSDSMAILSSERANIVARLAEAEKTNDAHSIGRIHEDLASIDREIARAKGVPVARSNQQRTASVSARIRPASVANATATRPIVGAAASSEFAQWDVFKNFEKESSPQ